jgi:ferredoxin
MAKEFVYITFVDNKGVHHLFNVCLFSDLSLFDLIKGVDVTTNCLCSKGYCQNCHIKILSGASKLPARSAVETVMLLQIPPADNTSRIACQIKINEALNGLIIIGQKHSLRLRRNLEPKMVFSTKDK